ncbi:MAG TPA: sigma factor [Chloroflexia bacterium]|nr:sigma factor [Chloroflexia bacterium]
MSELVAACRVAPGSGGQDRASEHHCERVVSAALFDACVRGGLPTATPDERHRQELAYRDLSAYLCTIARYLRLPPEYEAGDLVQETLIVVQQTHRHCRDPEAFLAWAATILRRQAQASWKDRPALRPLELDALDLAGQGRQAPCPPARDRSVDAAGDQELLRLLHDCLSTDEERLWALCMMLGLKRRELGLIFDQPLARFDYIARIVKRKLAANPQFRALFVQPPL